MDRVRLFALYLISQLRRILKRGPSVIYWPPFESSSDLNDSVSRACWYLPCIFPRNISFFYEGSFSIEAEERFSRQLPYIYNQLRRMGVLRVQKPQSDAGHALQGADIVILWRDLEESDHQWKQELEQVKKAGVSVYDVSKSRRMEGSFYIEISRAYYQIDKASQLQNQSRLRALLNRYQGARNAFVLCTGPSLEEYKNYDLSDGVAIACNSVINDLELMETVRPELLVFADPIFHFGCSRYTEQFMDALRAAAARFDFQILIPDKYYKLFSHALPELMDRTFTVAYDNDEPIALNMLSAQKIRTTDNILTFLMLPLASTISDTVRIFGCDGRPLEQDDYFWSHNPKAQFVGEMKSIQLAHPSFFKLEYNEYYLRHCETLEDYFSAGEDLGKRYVSMSFTHIPALQSRRFTASDLKSSRAPLFVSINPDLRDEEFGHFYRYDERLGKAMADEGEVVALAGKGFHRPAESALHALSTFTNSTWAVRDANSVEILDNWLNELILRLSDIALLERKLAVYMYLGSLEHIEKLANHLSALPQKIGLVIHINLFWSFLDFQGPDISDPSRAGRYKCVLRKLAAETSTTRVKVYADSEKLADAILRAAGSVVSHWPMIHILGEQESQILLDTRRSEDVLTVCCPANGQLAKGFDQVCDLIKNFLAQHKGQYRGRPIRFIVRNLMRDSDDGNKILEGKLAGISGDDTVRVIDGNISESEYVSLYADSHIVLLPYRRSAFYCRTSACLINALLASNRVLAIRDTWLGDLVESHSVGVCYDDDASEDAVLAAFESLLDQVIDSGDFSRNPVLAEQFSPKQLAAVIAPQ